MSQAAERRDVDDGLEFIFLIPEEMIEAPVLIDGTTIYAVIDTGATTNIMSRHLAETRFPGYLRAVDQPIRLLSAFGRTVDTSEIVDLTLRFKNEDPRPGWEDVETTARFWVVDHFPFDMLLGARFMKQNGFSIQMRERQYIIEKRCLVSGARPDTQETSGIQWIPKDREQVFLVRHLRQMNGLQPEPSAELVPEAHSHEPIPPFEMMTAGNRGYESEQRHGGDDERLPKKACSQRNLAHEESDALMTVGQRRTQRRHQKSERSEMHDMMMMTKTSAAHDDDDEAPRCVNKMMNDVDVGSPRVASPDGTPTAPARVSPRNDDDDAMMKQQTIDGMSYLDDGDDEQHSDRHGEEDNSTDATTTTDSDTRNDAITLQDAEMQEQVRRRVTFVTDESSQDNTQKKHDQRSTHEPPAAERQAEQKRTLQREPESSETAQHPDTCPTTTPTYTPGQTRPLLTAVPAYHHQATTNKQVMFAYHASSRSRALRPESSTFKSICRDALAFLEQAQKTNEITMDEQQCIIVLDEDVYNELAKARGMAEAAVMYVQRQREQHRESCNALRATQNSDSRGDDVLLPSPEDVYDDHESFQFGEDITEKEKQIMLNLAKQYAQTLSKGPFDVGKTDKIRHTINTGDARPISVPPHRMNPMQRQELHRQIQALIEAGFVRESCSPWAAPALLVKKKDGTWRFCIDHRQLNDITKKDAMPLPRVDDVLNLLAGAEFFTTLDFCCGYYHVPLDDQSCEKTAFITPFGLYEWTRMTMGLCNAPATFQRLMNHVLRDALGKFVTCYLDDIIIYSKTLKEHVENTKWVLEKIAEAGLKMKKKKCLLLARELTFLGSKVSGQGIAPDPAKIAAIRDWPLESLVDERAVKAFLGLAGYYRRFISNFASDAYPLTKLTRQGEPFIIGHEQKEAFEKLKLKLTLAPVLAHPDFDRPFFITTDASGYGLGAILKQLDEEGRERVIEYASRTLTQVEQKYPATHKECLAIVYGVEQFRYFVTGRRFSVITDHHSLCYLKKVRKPYGRLTHWALRLQDFDFDVVYKPGKSHKDADALSRFPRGLEGPPVNTDREVEDDQDLCARPKQRPLDTMDDVEKERTANWPSPTSGETVQVDETTAGAALVLETSSRDSTAFACPPQPEPVYLYIAHTINQADARKRRAAHSISYLSEQSDQQRPHDTRRATGGAQPNALPTKPLETVVDPRLEEGRLDLRKAQQEHKPSKDMLEYFEHGCSNEDPGVRKKAKFLAVKDGILCHWCYVKNDLKLLPIIPPKLRPAVLHAAHDCREAGHLGFDRTWARVHESFFWDGMLSRVREYVQSCTKCSQATVMRLAPAGFLVPFQKTTRPFSYIQMDKMGPCVMSDGHVYIFTIMDRATRMGIAMAARKGTAREALRLLRHVFMTYGPADVLLTDNGTEFKNEDVDAFCKEYRCKRLFITAHHAQTNGLVERLNSTLSNILKKFIDKNQKDWSRYLDYAMYAYNTSEHAATGMTPYFLLFGLHPPVLIDRWLRPGTEPPAHDFTNLHVLPEVREWAAQNVEEEQRRRRLSYNMSRREVNFAPDSQVMVRVPTNVGGDGLSARFRMPYI